MAKTCVEKNMILTHKNYAEIIRDSQHDTQTRYWRQLICPECHSENVLSTNGEYVCSDCGIVLETKIAVYHSPYDKEKRYQHPFRSYAQTQIGSPRERQTSSSPNRYKALQRLQNCQTHEKRIQCVAKFEINRLFTLLKLPHRLRKSVYVQFCQVRSQLKPRTKYRSPRKLLPPLIYIVHKCAGLTIDQTKLIEFSELNESEFREAQLLLFQLIPQYARRNRLRYIMCKISQLTSQLDLRMSFYHLAVRILKQFWEEIYNTTDHVVVGVVMSLATLAGYQNQISVNRICSALHISMSAVQRQVKRRIIRKLNLSGFTSLVKSAKLLHQVLMKLGLIETLVENSTHQTKESIISRVTVEDYLCFYADFKRFEKFWVKFSHYRKDCLTSCTLIISQGMELGSLVVQTFKALLHRNKDMKFNFPISLQEKGFLILLKLYFVFRIFSIKDPPLYASIRRCRYF